MAVLASLIGIGVGAGIARGLQALFQAAGAPFPAANSSSNLEQSWSLSFVGLFITLVSALMPARRASVIPPVAAMRDETPASRALGRRTMVGGFLFGAGLGLAVMSPRLAESDTMQGALMAGVAAGAVLIGVLALAPELARPATAVIGTLFRGISGRLARKHPPQPRRTAATAGALTIGVSDVGDQCPRSQHPEVRGRDRGRRDRC